MHLCSLLLTLRKLIYVCKFCFAYRSTLRDRICLQFLEFSKTFIYFLYIRNKRFPERSFLFSIADVSMMGMMIKFKKFITVYKFLFIVSLKQPRYLSSLTLCLETSWVSGSIHLRPVRFRGLLWASFLKNAATACLFYQRKNRSKIHHLWWRWSILFHFSWKDFSKEVFFFFLLVFFLFFFTPLSQNLLINNEAFNNRRSILFPHSSLLPTLLLSFHHHYCCYYHLVISALTTVILIMTL